MSDQIGKDWIEQERQINELLRERVVLKEKLLELERKLNTFNNNKRSLFGRPCLPRQNPSFNFSPNPFLPNPFFDFSPNPSFNHPFFNFTQHPLFNFTQNHESYYGSEPHTSIIESHDKEEMAPKEMQEAMEERIDTNLSSQNHETTDLDYYMYINGVVSTSANDEELNYDVFAEIINDTQQPMALKPMLNAISHIHDDVGNNINEGSQVSVNDGEDATLSRLETNAANAASEGSLNNVQNPLISNQKSYMYMLIEVLKRIPLGAIPIPRKQVYFYI